MEPRGDIAFVGQGPNQTAWKNGVARAETHGLKGDDVISFAENFCARLAITGRLGEFLARLAGVERLAMYSRCGRFNLNARFNGKIGKGDKFDKEEGKTAATKIFHESGATRLVLLGRNVAECFGFGDAESCKMYKRGGKRFLLLPHPSGINTWYNSAKNLLAARRALREFMGKQL